MRRWLFLVVALACGLARADTPLTVFKTWAGNVNFTGTVVTLRNDSANVCSLYAANTQVGVALAGIPSSATILSAQLYWAGSGSTPDYTVGFESGNVTSTAARSYTASITVSGTTYDFFSGAVDVTTQVQARKNGTYTFFGLAVNSANPYCASSAVLSGFSLVVVYSDSSQPYRVLNLYEGFQNFRSTSATYTASGFRVPATLTSAVTGRIGHISFEGAPGSTGEDLSFNGTRMTDSLNPAGDQFNSKSNINGNTASYGVDFDAYDVASPVIASGQTNATVTYASGTDLALSSAVLIAAPSDTLVDLQLTMTHKGTFQAGVAGAYTLSVFNAGPGTENGPITLIDTLPKGVSYVSASGTRWSCSAAGQVVTCKYNGLFTINTYLPDITLNVLPSTSGSITNTASATGVGYDTATANNSASDTTTVSTGSYSYAFTDSACTPNVAFGASGQCNVLTTDERLAAAYPVDRYLTVVQNGIPVARSTSASTTASVYFALTCVLPLKNAGVQATINTVALPLCADGPNAPAVTSTAWSAAMPLAFAASTPSAKITFYYADVGRLQLSAREATGSVSSSPTIISRPISLSMTIAGNPAAVSSTSAPFMPAGQAFPLKVTALMNNGAPAPNFGNGDASIVLTATRPSASGTADEPAMYAAMGAFPALVTTGLASGSKGTFNATAMFDEVGVLVLTAGINGYYFGVDDVTVATTKTGRFYPASFRTVVTPVFAACGATGATCTGATPGAAYATQAFDVAVTPLDIANNAVLNFRGVFGEAIDLSAVDSAGGAIVNPPASPTGAMLTPTTIPALAATGTNASLHASTSYALPVPFLYTRPANSAWTLPTPIFLRATSKSNTVTSKQTKISLEDGIMILNGRLLLSTVSGSELLRLPVTMSAQFWNKTGTVAGWLTNVADAGATPTAIAFSTCKRNLLVANACYSGLAMTPKDVAFSKGVGRFFIPAPGPGKTGSAMFNMTGAPAWLPSTLAQAVFGIYKSNFLYLREIY